MALLHVLYHMVHMNILLDLEFMYIPSMVYYIVNKPSCFFCTHTHTLFRKVLGEIV